MKYKIILYFIIATDFFSCTGVPDAPLPGEPGYYECYDCQELIRGPYLRVVPSGSEGRVSVWHTGTGRCILEDIDPEWQKLSSDRGPCVLFKGKDGRFGFFNSVTGECVIPPVHRRAWPFHEGRCAVEDDGAVRFLNEEGLPVFGDRTFPYYGHPLEDFVFRHGGCAVPDTSLRCGVIGMDGSWIILPEYKDVQYLDDCIVALAEGRRLQFAFNGTLLNPFVVDDVYPLKYNGKETGLYIFMVEERYGLMGGDGTPMTEAVYKAIEALSERLFQALLDDELSRVILDSKGRIIRN